MERYGNQSGDSGVVAYEVGDRSITVRFRGGATYLYTYASAGEQAVERMKRLAASGRGLSSFISRSVKDHYAREVH